MSERNDEILEAYRAGADAKELAQKYGVSDSRIYQLAKAAGILRREPGPRSKRGLTVLSRLAAEAPLPPEERPRPTVPPQPRFPGNGKATLAAPASTPAPIDVCADPFIRGLLQALPEPGAAWAADGRRRWLIAAEAVFDLMYQEGDMKQRTDG